MLPYQRIGSRVASVSVVSTEETPTMTSTGDHDRSESVSDTPSMRSAADGLGSAYKVATAVDRRTA